MKKLIKDMLKVSIVPFIFVTLISLFAGFSVSINISLTQKLIDAAVQNRNPLHYLLLIFILNIALVLSDNIGQLLTVAVDNSVETACGKEILKRTSEIEYQNFENAQIYPVIDRVTKDYKDKLLSLLDMFTTFVRLVSSAGGILAYLYGVKWWIAVLVTVLSVPITILYNKSSNTEVTVWRDSYPIMRKFNYLSRIMITREYAKETRLFNSYDYMTKQWEKNIHKWQDNIMQANVKIRFLVGAFYALQYIVIVGVIYLLLFPFKEGAFTIGLLIAVSNAMFSFITVFPNSVGQMIKQAQQFAKFNDDYRVFLTLGGNHTAYNANTYRKIIFEKITFSDVWFRYTKDGDYVIKGVSFTICKNQLAALVGRNGSGKTTLIKLLLGLLTPTKGEILINDINIKDIPASERKKIFSVVFQDFVKYSITLRENIMISNLDKECNDQTLLSILDKLNNQSKIADKLNNGLDTVLGKDVDGGIDISGGNWQTVAIARAIYSDSPCLILDEPTAALDPLAEVELYKQLFGVVDKKTGIFITHRLGSTVSSDDILVLDEGRLVEEGDHETLMKRDGLYAKMFNTQKQWYRREKYA